MVPLPKLRHTWLLVSSSRSLPHSLFLVCPSCRHTAQVNCPVFALQVDLLRSAPELIQPVPAAMGAAVAPAALRTELPGIVRRHDRRRRVSKPQATKQQQVRGQHLCLLPSACYSVAGCPASCCQAW